MSQADVKRLAQIKAGSYRKGRGRKEFILGQVGAPTCITQRSGLRKIV
jgi:hypothetical protein